MAARSNMSHFSHKNFSNSKTQKSRGKNIHDKVKKPDGRVGRLDEHTMGYYRRVADTIKDGFQDEDEQGLFLNNVFDQMEGEEVKLCQNQTVSRILEDVLLLARPSHVRRFLSSILREFEVIVRDRFAGHVVQKALLQSVKFYNDKEDGTELQEKVLSLAGLLDNNLDSVMMDTYGSHILRTVVQILGGVRVPDLVARSRLSREQQDQESSKQTELLMETAPEKMQLSLKKITNSVLNAENFNEYLLHRTSGPVFEVLLLVLHRSHPGLCHRLCQAILKKSKVMAKSAPQADGRIPVVLTDSIGSHLFEVVVEVTSSESFPEVFSRCFRGHLLEMALHPTANFILQRLIRRAAKEEEFSELFDTLSANIEAILGVNHMGVVLRLAEACTLHPTKQSPFLQALLKAFHCWEPRERQSTCVLLIASMVTHEVFSPGEKDGGGQDKTEKETPSKIFSDNPLRDQVGTGSPLSMVPLINTHEKTRLSNVNLHGSLLIQELLKFGHCGPIVTGFMALSDDDVIAMACSPSGSYLLEAFATSGNVSEKKKEKFVTKMKTHCFKIACHKTGSRSIDAVFKAASLKAKSALAQVLAEKEKQLQSDHFGKFVHRNCAIGLFKHRQRDWEELQGKESRKRKLFAEIIGEGDGTSATKKRKKKQKISEDSPQKLMSSYSEEMKALGMEEDNQSPEDLDDDDDIDEIFGKMPKSAGSSNSKNSKEAAHSHTPKASSEKRKSHTTGEELARSSKKEIDIITKKEVDSPPAATMDKSRKVRKKEKQKRDSALADVELDSSSRGDKRKKHKKRKHST